MHCLHPRLHVGEEKLVCGNANWTTVFLNHFILPVASCHLEHGQHWIDVGESGEERSRVLGERVEPDAVDEDAQKVRRQECP